MKGIEKNTIFLNLSEGSVDVVDCVRLLLDPGPGLLVLGVHQAPQVPKSMSDFKSWLYL